MNVNDYKSDMSIQMSSERVLLRGACFEDLDHIVNLAGDYRIADMMNGSLPHPYSVDDAREWIAKHVGDSCHSSSIAWVIIAKAQEELVGSVQIRLSEDRCTARMSYWIGYPYWNLSYASESGKCVIRFGFEKLHLKEINAEHFQRNPASGAVLRKLGFSFKRSEIKIEKLNNREEHFDTYSISSHEFSQIP